MNQDEKKKKAAEAAFLRVLPSLNKETILGIGLVPQLTSL